MERVKQKMEKARKQREGFQHPRTRAADGLNARRPASSHARSALIATMASNGIWGFLGVAAGISITMIVWWSSTSNSTADTEISDSPSLITNQTAEVSHSHSRTNVTVMLTEDITQLSERVRQLTNNVTDLEVKLLRVQVLANSTDAVEGNVASVVQQQQSIVSNSETILDQVTPPAAGVADTSTERTAVITPTHSVNAKLNLRPSASLDTAPIGLLPVGTKVEIISENGDWFYVNTQSLGKGWCYSSYLSPLMYTQQ